MKKFAVLVAALLVLGFAGQGMAYFSAGDLIRVVYDTTGTYEYATDLGALSAIRTDANNTIIANSAFTPTTLSSSDTYGTLVVTYYVQQSTTLTGGQYYFAGLTAPTVHASASYTAMNTQINAMAATYGNFGTQNVLINEATYATSPTYYNKMDLGGASAGTYDQLLFAGATESSLSSLATGGNVQMNVYGFKYNNSTKVVSAQGELSGLTLETVVSGGHIVTEVNPATVPVPPSMLLLAPCLLGLFGLRKKVHKA